MIPTYICIGLMFYVDLIMVSCLLDYSFYQICWINTYLEGVVDLYCNLYIYNLSQNSNIFFIFILYRKSQKEMLKTEIKRKRLTNTFIDVAASRLQLGWMRRCVISIFQKLSILLIVIN